MTLLRYLMVAGVAFVPAASFAQETTASGNLQMETSWNALKSLVDGANSKAQAAQILATAIKDCGVKGMFYSPGVAGADAQGCKAPPSQPVGFSQFRHYGGSGYSNNTVVTSGWHSLCVLAFNHNDSNFWLRRIAGPNADGKNRWQATRGWGGAEPELMCMD